MSKTYHNKCHFPGFMQTWRSLLGNLSYIAVAVFISTQIAMFAAQPAQAVPQELILKNPPVLQPCQKPTPPTTPLVTPKATENQAQAATEERILKNPPVLQPTEKPTLGNTLLATPKATAGVSPKNEQQFDLKIQYIDSKICNPATGQYDNVRLRGYTGTGSNPNDPYVAPTIEIKPGDTVRISLKNELPIDPTCFGQTEVNTPHCFNGTNLHSHGLWVSPTGNSDNVLLSINPGVSFQYEYNLPPDHPSGTFWYHPHRHGSTALQVSSGMAGALIVRGDRLPKLPPDIGSKFVHGDIDTLLKDGQGNPFEEHILVLQQIQYYCPNSDNPWVCSPSDTGVIESYNNFGPRTWDQSGRYTTINGEVLPTIAKTEVGKIERWRMIHAGVRNTISLEFRKEQTNAPSVNGLKAADAEKFIGENCTGDPIPYHVIADDGLTRAAAWKTTLTTLQPGYRSDALVVFPQKGTYCVIDTSATAAGSVSRSAESRQLLGLVDVSGDTEIPDIHQYLKDQLVAAAERTMPDGNPLEKTVRRRVVDDLKNGLKLSLFTPHPTIQDGEVTGKQELAFFINTGTPNAQFEVSNTIGSKFDPKPYDPERIDRTLYLGDIDEWTLQSYFVSHPFHIHVNPFQIVKILDPNGKDVSLPKATDNVGGPDPDPQYPGLKGVWKDTLWIKSLLPQNPNGFYKIVLRTRYQRYIGEFVLHCHILDHEDQGMMQNVSIVLPSQP